MGNLNLQVNAIAFNDSTPSNNPAIRVFDFGWKLLGQTVSRPKSEEYAIAPGSSQVIFNGTRNTYIDNSTAFTITQPYPSLLGTYRFTNTAGTAPVFRTARSLGIDNTSVITVTANGPVSTYTQVSGTAMNTASVIVGDILNIGVGSGFSQSNQGVFVIIAKTSNSLSVQNLNAVGETATIADVTQFIAYSNGGGVSNQIQIDDKVIISSGFSVVTQGTYTISAVTPSYFEITLASPKGIPLETNIAPGVGGIVFYSTAKKFIMIAAQQKCSVQVNSDISDNNLVEPEETNNPERPGLYIKQGTVYGLTIHNLSLETLSVIVASAE
jgi:hypothetical protein